MSIDLVCGHCQGRLLAEQPGGVVVCPHCGTHLQVPGEVAQPTEPVENPPLAETGLVISELEPADELSSPNQPAAHPVEMVTVDESLLAEETVPAAMAAPGLTPLAAAPAVIPPPAPPVAMTPAAAPVEPVGMPQLRDDGPVVPPTVPRFWFYMVSSYASAVTLALLFVLFTLGRMKLHPLESLPDVVPEIQNGEVALKVAAPESNVAPNHVLPLGLTRRFGSLNVTPLRVTLGPLRFEHFLKDPTAVRSASEPVLKLWLKFENVSRNQKFIPLDPLLLFKRHYQSFGKPVLTNQFLCRADQRRSDGVLHHLFDLSPTSEFRIAGQNLETVLSPGETLETFVPSEELLDDLTGDLVWRVQFRKGYHPRTRHGVTTLIDIPFSRSDVKAEI